MSAKKYQFPLPEGNGKPVVVDGVRTPFVKSFGVFENCETLDLFTWTIDALVRKTGIDPEQLDEVSAGVVIPQTSNPNVARDAIINLGLPDHIHGYTLNRACTSSLQTVADAARSIAYGHPGVILAGGVECLSDVPIVYSKEARKFLLGLNKARSTSAKVALISEFSASAWVPKPPGLTEPMTGHSMGEHAEFMAKLNGIDREAQDEFALASHQKAHKAQEAGYLDDEVIPVWPVPRYEPCVERDNLIRSDSTMEAMAKLRPVFDKKYGTITAANASPLTDGAAVTLVADEKRARDLGLKPKTRIADVAFVGVQPHPQLLIGPAIAIPLLMKKNKLAVDDIDFFEIHEAFAAQVLSCLSCLKSREFFEKHFGTSEVFGEIPREKLNVNGGAIALGHPFGATGSRLITSLSNQLVRSQKRYGVIAICAAGGMSGAMLLERTED